MLVGGLPRGSGVEAGSVDLLGVGVQRVPWRRMVGELDIKLTVPTQRLQVLLLVEEAVAIL